MKYDLEQEHQVIRFEARCEELKKRGALVDLTDKSKRSVNQNNYMHLLFSAFAMEYGCSEHYAKQNVFKGTVCPDIFVYFRTSKTGVKLREKRSTASIPKEQMTESINRFKEWSAKEAGIPLPEATDQGWLRSIEVEAERMKEYLK